MEENYTELSQVKDDIANMTDEEREYMQKLVGATIVGVFKSIDKDAAIENTKNELKKLVGEEFTDEDFDEFFGSNGVSEIVDMFSSLTTDNVASLIEQIGINMFIDVGDMLEQNIQEKLTTGEE